MNRHAIEILAAAVMLGGAALLIWATGCGAVGGPTQDTTTVRCPDGSRCPNPYVCPAVAGHRCEAPSAPPTAWGASGPGDAGR